MPLSRAALQPLMLALCVDPARQLFGAARLLLGWVETALTDFGNAPAVRGRVTRKERGVLR